MSLAKNFLLEFDYTSNTGALTATAKHLKQQ